MKLLLPLLFAATVGAAVAAPPRETPPSPRVVRIALVSDTHTNHAPEGDQVNFKERLEKVITAVNDAGVDMVLVAGDLTESGKPEQFANFAQEIKGFRAPVRVVPGNHDVGAKHLPDKPGAGVTSSRVADFEKRIGASYWVENIAGVRVVGMNASLFGSGLPEEAAEWKLLETTLVKPINAPTVLLTHYPLFLEKTDEPGGDYWNIEPAPRARLLPLLRRGGVRAVLSGHLHRPLEIRQNGVLYKGTPPVSFGLPRGKQPEGWTLITVPLPCKSGDTIRAEFRPLAEMKETK